MNPDLEPLIEAFLLQKGGWVSTQAICQHFAIDPRDLRSIGKVPGLCSRFAVSGMRGYIHYKHATTEEKLKFKHRKYGNAISQIRSFKLVEKAWRAEAVPAIPYAVEKSTGQAILL